MNYPTPTRSNVVVLTQILNLIPRNLINRHARETGADAKARTFSVRSHLAAMLFAQLSHAIGLNDVCDWLRMKAAVLGRGGLTPPARNTLSHANKQRSADFAEKPFWSVLGHLQHAQSSFASGRRGKGLLRRFKVRIHAVDSTVMQLVANCMDWAKHRRRKAAAKMHLRLDLHSFLPSFAIVDTAGQHDNKRAREVCAGIAAGEIVVFDKAYVDFDHLADLDDRGVWSVTRAKDNMAYRAVKHLSKGDDLIIKDQIVALKGRKGMRVRRVEAWVEVDGEWRVMVFITNNLTWSPRSVCDLSDGELSQFDHCLNSMLLRSYVALRQGDQIGVLGFREATTWFPPLNGPHSMNAVLKYLYDSNPSPFPAITPKPSRFASRARHAAPPSPCSPTSAAGTPVNRNPPSAACAPATSFSSPACAKAKSTTAPRPRSTPSNRPSPTVPPTSPPKPANRSSTASATSASSLDQNAPNLPVALAKRYLGVKQQGSI